MNSTVKQSKPSATTTLFAGQPQFIFRSSSHSFTPISKAKPSDVCFTCGQQGHWRFECSLLLKLYRRELASNISSGLSGEISKGKLTILTSLHLLSLTTLLLARGFPSSSVKRWVTAGGIAVWGPVDQVASPHLVLLLTVEPTKPRLCHDERYLNLWIRDLPFKLDHLCDLPRYVLPHHFQTTFDDKNGYQLFTVPLRMT